MRVSTCTPSTVGPTAHLSSVTTPPTSLNVCLQLLSVVIGKCFWRSVDTGLQHVFTAEILVLGSSRSMDRETRPSTVNEQPAQRVTALEIARTEWLDSMAAG